MKVTQCTYTCRLTLGQYQHEELSATVEPELGEVINGNDLMREARKICLSNSTQSLTKKKDKKGSQEG